MQAVECCTRCKAERHCTSPTNAVYKLATLHSSRPRFLLLPRNDREWCASCASKTTRCDGYAPWQSSLQPRRRCSTKSTTCAHLLPTIYQRLHLRTNRQAQRRHFMSARRTNRHQLGCCSRCADDDGVPVHAVRDDDRHRRRHAEHCGRCSTWGCVGQSVVWDVRWGGAVRRWQEDTKWVRADRIAQLSTTNTASSYRACAGRRVAGSKQAV
jgi:hypothetical protein